MVDETEKPIRLLNFVSEEQLDESKKERGERVEDGTFQRDRALYEILKENKDKKDAEFNERFKHSESLSLYSSIDSIVSSCDQFLCQDLCFGPPKALDEDETEFLDKLEMSKREYERQLANEEDEQLRNFQAAVAARSAILHEPKEAALPPPAPVTKEQKPIGKRNPATRPFKAIIKVKPQPKKAKATEKEEKEIPGNGKPASHIDQASLDSVKGNVTGKTTEGLQTGLALVSYSDESEDDD
ncbi:hypothetical protein [Arabidopsis thaliana]|uniref:Uncharacterized protein T17J13.100 n=2 Tax=Arabidopsis thaliana TaxID=3702 RepID=Q9M1R0_ARATH|nr:hypothetical protein [Arabidopsis thaliana]